MADYTYTDLTSYSTDDVIGGIKTVQAVTPAWVKGTDTLDTSKWFTNWCVMICTGATDGGVAKYVAPGATILPGTGTEVCHLVMFGQ